MAEPWWQWPGRIVVGGALLGLVGLLSNLPAGTPAHDGLLRLAWRSAGESVRLCRQRSAEELSRLAPHMRQPQECHQRTLPYRLRVRVDGAERIAHPVRAVGARGDRPLYVQQELPLAPGQHALEISFTVAPELARGPEGIAVADDAQRAALEAALQSARGFHEATTVQVRAGRIVLVELDEQGGAFRVTGG